MVFQYVQSKKIIVKMSFKKIFQKFSYKLNLQKNFSKNLNIIILLKNLIQRIILSQNLNILKLFYLVIISPNKNLQ